MEKKLNVLIVDTNGIKNCILQKIKKIKPAVKKIMLEERSFDKIIVTADKIIIVKI